MTKTIEFYFDFSSPYGYFASFKVDNLAKKFNRIAVWKPILIGAAFRQTGAKPLADIPLKGAYCRMDWQRMSDSMQVPWSLPDPFPIAATAPSRVFYWLSDQDSDQAKQYAQEVYRAYFAEGRNIADPEIAADIASEVGADRNEVGKSLETDALKERFKRETNAAIERGVFGSPFIFVDGEGFWGSDRMWMIKKKLQDQKW
jgi:2-hydroxychromene-2-carboxylate isomerase